jgi:pyruvate/2-oxoglutarate/acetoin dehydrogenase E1 component
VPVERITGANAPTPYAKKNLERLNTPTPEKVAAAVRRVGCANGS